MDGSGRLRQGLGCLAADGHVRCWPDSRNADGRHRRQYRRCVAESRAPPRRWLDDTPPSDAKPGFYVLCGALSFSVFPLLIEVFDAGSNPFAFYFWFGTGTAIGTALFLFFYVNILHRQFFAAEREAAPAALAALLFKPEPRTAKSGSLADRLWHRKILTWAIAGRTSVAFLALSAGFVASETAAVIYESWAVFYVVLRGLDSVSIRSAVPARTVGFFCVAASGLLLVAVSENGSLGDISITGVGFGVAGAVLAAVSLERSIKWGEKAEQAITKPNSRSCGTKVRNKTYREIRIVTVFTLAATILMNLAASAVSAVFVFVFHWTKGDPVFAFSNFFYPNFGWVFLLSIPIGAIEIVGFRKGGLEATEDKIFAVAYFMPIMAVCWLWAHSLYTQGAIQLDRPDYFAAGVLAVVAANLALNLSHKPPKQKQRARSQL